MTNAEAKEALFNRRKVTARIRVSLTEIDIEYDRVSAIIYREKDGKVDVTLELEEKTRTGKSVSIVRPEQVRYAEERIG